MQTAETCRDFFADERQIILGTAGGLRSPVVSHFHASNRVRYNGA
jgi:hypothetical protein